MVNFLLCVAQYLLIMAGLAVIGGIGAFIGIRLRRSKNAKMEAEAVNAKEEA